MGYNGWTIQEIVTDPEWQALRASLVGTWKKTPEENVERLYAYIAVNPDDPFRWFRVRNYIVGSAFRMRIIEHPHIDVLYEVVSHKCAGLTLPEKQS